MAEMEQRVELNYLLDFYGPLLTEHRRELMRLYCEEDLSLAEIADQMEITRQGVSDAIGKARRQLSDYEEKLGLVAKYGQTQANLEKLADIVWEMRGINNVRYHDSKITALCDEAFHIAKQLSE